MKRIRWFNELSFDTFFLFDEIECTRQRLRVYWIEIEFVTIDPTNSRLCDVIPEIESLIEYGNETSYLTIDPIENHVRE